MSEQLSLAGPGQHHGIECAVEGCDRPRVKRQWCDPHYLYWYRRGVEPTYRILDLTDEQRFWAQVEVSDFCWRWTGTAANGYGRFGMNGRTYPAHQCSFLWDGGTIPEGYELDHLCKTPLCVRPDHLEAVTHAENLRRADGWSGINARKTHCIRGHEFTPENTLVRTGQEAGWRACRTCVRAGQALRRERIRREKRTA